MSLGAVVVTCDKGDEVTVEVAVDEDGAEALVVRAGGARGAAGLCTSYAALLAEGVVVLVLDWAWEHP